MPKREFFFIPLRKGVTVPQARRRVLLSNRRAGGHASATKRCRIRLKQRFVDRSAALFGGIGGNHVSPLEFLRLRSGLIGIGRILELRIERFCVVLLLLKRGFAERSLNEHRTYATCHVLWQGASSPPCEFIPKAFPKKRRGILSARKDF